MGRLKDSTIPADGPDVTHDPLCTVSSDSDGRDFDWCMCPLIAKVRKDQTQRCIDALEGDDLHDPDPLWSGTHWNNAVFECAETLRAGLRNDSVPDPASEAGQ
jgi:hypothetical protein